MTAIDLGRDTIMAVQKTSSKGRIVVKTTALGDVKAASGDGGKLKLQVKWSGSKKWKTVSLNEGVKIVHCDAKAGEVTPTAD